MIGCHGDDGQFAVHPLLRPCPISDTRDIYEIASEVLSLVSSHDFSPPFSEPLDTDAMGVSAKYDEVVKYRMDLGSVRTRLNQSLNLMKKASKTVVPSYTVVELVKDVRTVWHNCIIFNAEGSAIVRMAKHLSKVFPFSSQPLFLILTLFFASDV